MPDRERRGEARQPRPKADAPDSVPPCPYRSPHEATTYRCEAAEGSVVTGDDCRRCAIPDALAHPQACLYLVALRHENEARFACPWYFSWASEPTVRDWRRLCFCSFWFPRTPDERQLTDSMRQKRARYLRVLRGEEARGRSRDGPAWRRVESVPGWFSHLPSWVHGWRRKAP